YKLNRMLCSVEDIWREYTEGLSGFPPVEKLEEDYGTRWRKNASESRYFLRRKTIYDEIRRIAAENN
ncbi:hypothetical protein K501DRAFT_142007, partial [Backusella circina FSU 941]